jgi:hypothetical protein
MFIATIMLYARSFCGNSESRSPKCVLFTIVVAAMLFFSGMLLLYTAIVVPAQIFLWDYTDLCSKFPTLYFDVLVDSFFMVRRCLRDGVSNRRPEDSTSSAHSAARFLNHSPPLSLPSAQTTKAVLLRSQLRLAGQLCALTSGPVRTPSRRPCRGGGGDSSAEAPSPQHLCA